jgi:RNA polymerase sigma-70 factor (ECF subfamily)
VLLRGFRALGSLKEPEKFGPWLRGIAQRVCLDWIKSRKRTPVGFGELSNGDVAGAVPSGEPSADEAACQADEQARLLRHVEQLPETLREVLMIYYYDEVTYREMAELLEVSPATINKRLTQARALLRRRLSQPFIPTAAPLP